MIEIAKILKAQGIKGEIKVLPITFDEQKFAKLKEVIIDNTSFIVIKTSLRQGFAYMQLNGVSDRNAAEKFSGKFISIKDSELAKLPKDTYYIRDLLGCNVYKGDQLLGEIYDIKQFGAADVIMVRGEKNYSFPFLKDSLESVNILDKKVILNAKRLEEIIVED